MQKVFLLALSIFTYSTVQTAHAESSFEQELQRGCQAVSQHAALGKKLYDQKNYKKALEHFQTDHCPK